MIDPIFAPSFIVPRFGRAFIRTSKNRLPIRLLYGPNLTRELVKDSSAAAWQSGIANIAARVGFLLRRFESEGGAPRKTRVFPDQEIAVWFGFQGQEPQ